MVQESIVCFLGPGSCASPTINGKREMAMATKTEMAAILGGNADHTCLCLRVHVAQR